jgi:hypothetical protein
LIRPLPKAVLDVESAGAHALFRTLDLKPGDQLVTEDGDRLTFQRNTLRQGPTQAHNLEVADRALLTFGSRNAVCAR